MQSNVGRVERVIRVTLGVLLIGFGVGMNSWWGWLGLLPLLTGVMGWCPVSSLLGISTSRVKEDEVLPDTSGQEKKEKRRIDFK
ncbi:MAG TPA: DUF2892 domain-containing protein [Desulfomicrobiaceae bacterium]|nr:DUF2892 domain-containing protein [Desulfomicrobiaceae bacterium]